MSHCEGEICDFYLLSGFKYSRSCPSAEASTLFSLLSLMSAILLLSRQPGVTDISQQFAVIAQLQETIFKMNISPLLLKFNCIGSQSCGFMSGANITLSQLISREGQLQLVSCTVEDVYLFSMSFNMQKWILFTAFLILQHINN